MARTLPFLSLLLVALPLAAQEPAPSIKPPSSGMVVPMISDEEMRGQPATGQGQLIFNKTEQAFYWFDGQSWQPLLTAVPSTNNNAFHWSTQRIGKDQGAPKLTSGTTGFWDLTGNNFTDPSINFLGTTDFDDVVFRTNNLERMRIRADGRIGVNTTNPVTDLFTVEGTATSTLQGITISKVDASTTPGALRIEHARGTPLSKAPLLSGDRLGEIMFNGFQGTQNAPGALIQATATENFGTSATGTELSFFTSPNGQGGTFRRMKIDHDGEVGIGPVGASPASMLHVTKNSSALTPNANTIATFENSVNPAYISLLTMSTTENGLLFGNDGLSIGSAIIYGNTAVPQGFQFRTGGNFTRMTLDQNGRLGINANNPLTRVDINGGLTVRRPATVVLVSGANTVTVGDNSYLRIQGAASSTVNLSNGLSTGQLLYVEGTSANSFTINDNAGVSNCNLAANRVIGSNDTLTLLWNGTDWIELAFVNN